jgi:hypothetical protein
MNLLYLSPDIQEEIFFLPPVADGRTAVTERHLREVLNTVVWSEQRERWASASASADSYFAARSSASRCARPRARSTKRWVGDPRGFSCCPDVPSLMATCAVMWLAT